MTKTKDEKAVVKDKVINKQTPEFIKQLEQKRDAIELAIKGCNMSQYRITDSVGSHESNMNKKHEINQLNNDLLSVNTEITHYKKINQLKNDPLANHKKVKQ